MRQFRTVLVAGVLVLSACGGSAETVATDPVTTLATTTSPAPTTTTTAPLASWTDSGGLLYRVESAPWFGGFELHILSRGIQYGFAETPAGAETASEMLLRLVLWTFASQHSQFVTTGTAGYTTIGGDGQVDIDGYVAFLEANDWVDDEVYVPVTVGDGLDLVLYAEGNAGVEKSPVLRLDFKQPFIIGNDDLTKLDGFEMGEPNLLFNCDGCRTLFGVTANGQIYYSLHEIVLKGGPSRGTFKPLDIPPNNSVVLPMRLGEVLEATSRITYPEPSPYEQWKNPTRYYNNLFMVKPESLAPPYPVLNLLELVGYDAATKTTINKLFAPTDL